MKGKKKPIGDIKDNKCIYTTKLRAYVAKPVISKACRKITYWIRIDQDWWGNSPSD